MSKRAAKAPVSSPSPPIDAKKNPAHQPIKQNASTPYASPEPSASPSIASSAPSPSASPAVGSSFAPISSPHDPHLYRHITLNNGLTALLIVDAPKSQAERAREGAKKKAAAKQSSTSGGEPAEDESKPAVVSLSVRVGHFSDPAAIPGLAHFCEHMLFMGNAAYPSENEWEEYLSDHGGASNAFTEAEQTVYYFEINPTSLHPALQRFAQFFVSPLFAASATKREIRAVDSEFRDCFNEDSERQSELIISTAAEVNPSHPFGKFGWGNLESLETNLKPKKTEQPAGKKNNTKGAAKNASPAPAPSPPPIIDLRAELKAFHARYYSAHAMCLVVYHAGGKLEKLERWIRNEFEAIENNGLPLVEFKNAGHPFVAPPTDGVNGAAKKSSSSASSPTPSSDLTSCLQRIYHLVPIKEIYKLTLSWIITPALSPEFYAKKPIHYAEHLLGHESSGSLYSLLRKQGWITSLVAGVNESGTYRNSAFECMQLQISMTKEGAEKVMDILDLIFQYLALIRQPKNIHPEIFSELKQLSEIGFLFSETQDPSDMVQDYALNMHLYPPEDIIRGDFLHTEFDRDLTVSVLDRLSVENCRIDIAVPENKHRFASELKKAPWFHTQYTSEHIPVESFKKWTRYHSQPDLISKELHLPLANQFIPTSFDIRVHESAEDAKLQQDNHGPVLLSQSKKGEFWWNLDEKFKLPRANVHILLETPVVYQKPETVALSELLIKLWVDSINEYAYQASLAELEFSIESLRSGIELKFSGFHHKLVQFVEAILSGLTDLETFLLKPDSQLRFDSMKERTYRHFKHLYFIPLKQASHARLTVLQKDKFPAEEITQLCKAITIQTLVEHVRSVLASVRLIGLVDGNLSKQEAQGMFSRIEFTICARANPPPRRVELSLSLPAGHIIYLDQRARNIRESNHAIEVYFQIGRATIFNRAILNLLESLVSEPGFDQLRTKEQLGYKVQSGIRNTHGILGFCVSIQSASYEPGHLAGRIESFLWNTFYHMLLSMSEEKFATQRASLVAEHLYEDTHLGERIDRQWEELTENRSYCFARPKIMAKQVATVTHQQIVQFYEHHFLGIVAQPPQPSESKDQEDVTMSDVSSSASAPVPAPSPVASPVSLTSDQLEAQRKEERKQAKKARTASARAAKSASAGASESASQKDPVAEAAIQAKVNTARQEPVLYRRQLVVSVYGHAHAKSSGGKGKSVRNHQSDDDGDTDMQGSGDEDAAGEDDDDEGEGGESGEDAGSDEHSDDENDDDSSISIDSLWFSPDEWRQRLEEAARKQEENASAAATQPPTKKQRNGRNKNTPTHAASPTASVSPPPIQSTTVWPSPPRIQANLQDGGVSINCPCVTTDSTSSASSPPSEHTVRIRTLAALDSFKRSSEFEPDCSGPEPDLPISAIAKP